MSRPKKEEYAEYYETYVSLVEEIDIVSALEKQLSEWHSLFAEISEEKANFRYAEGKWSIKEVVGHLIDGERVFAYRAFRFSRNDKTSLSGFEQNSYVANSNFSNAELTDLIEELLLLRRANILFFKNLSDEAWLRTGTASEAEVSVRALAYIMVGHIRHHANILRSRYLAQ
jgi:uncharacterized damage-inducible protein DinB